MTLNIIATKVTVRRRNSELNSKHNAVEVEDSYITSEHNETETSLPFFGKNIATLPMEYRDVILRRLQPYRISQSHWQITEFKCNVTDKLQNLITPSQSRPWYYYRHLLYQPQEYFTSNVTDSTYKESALPDYLLR